MGVEKLVRRNGAQPLSSVLGRVLMVGRVLALVVCQVDGVWSKFRVKANWQGGCQYQMQTDVG